MGIFGWSLPPGVTDRMIDEAVGANHCEKFAALGHECSANTHGECDCPKCQGLQHLNLHKNCLHLWRPQNAEIPRPPAWMVAPVKERV